MSWIITDTNLKITREECDFEKWTGKIFVNNLETRYSFKFPLIQVRQSRTDWAYLIYNVSKPWAQFSYRDWLNFRTHNIEGIKLRLWRIAQFKNHDEGRL